MFINLSSLNTSLRTLGYDSFSLRRRGLYNRRLFLWQDNRSLYACHLAPFCFTRGHFNFLLRFILYLKAKRRRDTSSFFILILLFHTFQSGGHNDFFHRQHQFLNPPMSIVSNQSLEKKHHLQNFFQ